MYLIPLLRLGKILLAENVTKLCTLRCKIRSHNIYVWGKISSCAMYLSMRFDICEPSGVGRKVQRTMNLEPELCEAPDF